MKVTAISCAKNYTHFTSSRKSKQTKKVENTRDYVDSRKIALASGVMSLAAIGITALCTMYTKNVNPIKEASNLAQNVVKSVKEFKIPSIPKIDLSKIIKK